MGCGFCLLLLRPDMSTVPEVLFHFQHNLVLVFGQALDGKFGDVERDLRDITLIRGFPAEADLGKVAFGGIGKTVTFRQLDQFVLTGKRVMVLGLLPTSFEGKLPGGL